MGFKVDTSFLKFLTMGALGARTVISELQRLGFQPVELERYCTSNKIWATKVKRLRIADLLCVRTGLRVEVRAKSKLAIRMSDAPNNPDRAWDAGLRDEDIIALIACSDSGYGPVPADAAVYLQVEALRGSVASSTLGPPKSASEGAERDRTWPSTVPSNSGEVISVEQERLVVLMDGQNRRRRQSYSLNGKRPYVAVGDRFDASTTILAGTPASLADLRPYLEQRYNPLNELLSPNPLDRYAGAKALRFRADLFDQAVPALEALMAEEPEPRVALEAAGTATALGAQSGQDHLTGVLWQQGASDLSMEAILILTEIGGAFASDTLTHVASSERLTDDERRQAAVWGLGKSGLKSYDRLVPFVSDREENVAFHAIAGFASDASGVVVDQLINVLVGPDGRAAAAASEALRMIGSTEVLDSLVRAERERNAGRYWILATIGRLAPDAVRARLQGTALLEQLEPVLLVSQGANWLADDEARSDFAFLIKQSL